MLRQRAHSLLATSMAGRVQRGPGRGCLALRRWLATDDPGDGDDSPDGRSGRPGSLLPSPSLLRQALIKKAKAASGVGDEGDDGSSQEHSGGGNEDRGGAVQKLSVPEEYPQLLALPISGRPLFPGFYKAIVVKNRQVIKAIRELVQRGQPYIGVFLQRNEDAEDVDVITNWSQVYRVGVFAQIINLFSNINDHLTLVLYPHRRIRMKKLILSYPLRKQLRDRGEKVDRGGQEEPEKKGETMLPTQFLVADYALSVANVENLRAEQYNKNGQFIKAVTSEIVSVFKDIATLNPLFRDQIANFSMSQSSNSIFDNPASLADFAAAVSVGDSSELQSILESLVVEERLKKSLVILKKELLNARLQNKISKDIENKLSKRQREFYLMEQLKVIKRELGLESDGKDKLMATFRERAEKLTMPAEVQRVYEEELSRLEHLESSASEFNVCRNYLDWLTQLPWGKYSHDNYDLAHAMAVLDADHYGLRDVKQRILEFIAVGKLRGKLEGKIICLVGPPGVGKTSIGRSVARALQREFFRFSVGGLFDVAEIKGHRRTYIGAMPGKIVQALKKVRTQNPLVLIDEIDKLARGHYQGDPASALLELLDPEQNVSFVDHYMDVPVDLSKVLFVCTANTTDTIPEPLLDRMEVIELPGYIAVEKHAISLRHLIPQACHDAGLDPKKVVIAGQAIDQMIRGYCRESGVRGLKKAIEKVYRKVALEAVQGKLAAPATTILPEHLSRYLGPAPFTSDRLYESTPPGVVMGLAWTSGGGSTLYVESIVTGMATAKEKDRENGAAVTPGLTICTGQLGDVMKESTSIAYTYAKHYTDKHYPGLRCDFFDRAAIHLHVPEGATPKDGPSAGITMATAILSLAFGRAVPADVAMTGELTLTGRVLRIGGLKEKVIAAKQSAVRRIFFPKDNMADWLALDGEVRAGLEPVSVEWYDQLIEALPLTPNK